MASARAAAPLLLSVLLVGGCTFSASVDRASSSSASSSGGSASGTTGAASGSTTGGGATTSPEGTDATGRCHTGELSGSLVPGSPGAGQRYATLVLTNTAARTCTVHGYGGLGLTGSDGAALPTKQVRVSDPAPTTVSVPPGGTASAQLHWGAVTGTGDAQDGPCQATPATLQVIPPDETTAVSVPWTEGPVCEGGTIDQQAYTH